MKISREDVATKLRAYLRHELSLTELVDWAERAMYDGEFDDKHFMQFATPSPNWGWLMLRRLVLLWKIVKLS
jgi:hypothetical protein